MKAANLGFLTAVLGAVAVVLGAFGAHAFKDVLMATGRLETYETAVNYHFYHIIAVLCTVYFNKKVSSKLLRWSSTLFLLGIAFFSGSLYILCLTEITILGAITPVGGVFLISGWIMLALYFLQSKD